MYVSSTGHCEDVTQYPEISWRNASKSVEMYCRNGQGGPSIFNMYWYKQRPGESMRLIVYTIRETKIVYMGSNEGKYSTKKNLTGSVSLTVNNLLPEDSGMYFCAFSKHIDANPD